MDGVSDINHYYHSYGSQISKSETSKSKTPEPAKKPSESFSKGDKSTISSEARTVNDKDGDGKGSSIPNFGAWRNDEPQGIGSMNDIPGYVDPGFAPSDEDLKKMKKDDPSTKEKPGESKGLKGWLSDKFDKLGEASKSLGKSVDSYIDSKWDPQDRKFFVEEFLAPTAEKSLNVLTLGYSDAIMKNEGNPKAQLAAVGENTANLLTFGGYEGYKKDGIGGALQNIRDTVLPNDREMNTLFSDESSWDQKLGAGSSSALKLLSLGKMGGKMVSSKPATALEISQAKYGYHFTKPDSKGAILENGLEARAPGAGGAGSHTLPERSVSAVAGAAKTAFVDGEGTGQKAAYMFGSTKPGKFATGINAKEPPIVIDLSKIPLEQLRVRPFDGAIISTKDIPKNALSAPTTWADVPISNAPFKSSMFGNKGQASPYAGTMLMAEEGNEQIKKN